MDLPALIAALSAPSAYPHPAGEVDVHQTHISVVFLAGPYAYKIKKPVSLTFLDYSTLERRKHFCEEETTLNRRLAPDVYLGVVAVTQAGNAVQLDGAGAVVEWAVKMKRLPSDATLSARLDRGEIGAEQLAAVAYRIAAFHASADRGAAIAAAGRFETVASNARENFTQSTTHVGHTVSATVFARARALNDHALEVLRPLIEARAARGVPRDGHGDLRLDHIYLFPSRVPPADLVIVDAIEFNARFRHADPVADMAFIDMDLGIHGRRDLARAFSDAYFEAADDAEGQRLLPFYRAYRAAVRAKVEGITSLEPEVPAPARDAALQRAQAHWLLALGALEEPGQRPCLVLVGGLPGTGKSTLARGLAEQANFEVIRSDIVRKELATLAGIAPAAGEFEQGIYSPEWTERTYAHCLKRAEALLFEGRRVLVDATFGREKHRTQFLDAAARWGIPGILLVCEADRRVALERLAQRRGDASDANPATFEQAASRWEPVATTTRRLTQPIPSGGGLETTIAAANSALCRFHCGIAD